MIPESDIMEAGVFEEGIDRGTRAPLFMLSLVLSMVSHGLVFILCFGLGLLPRLQSIVGPDDAPALVADLINRQEYQKLFQPPPETDQKGTEALNQEPPPAEKSAEKPERPPKIKGYASDQVFDGPIVFDVDWSEQHAYIRRMLPEVKRHIKYKKSDAPPEKVRSVISFSLQKDGAVEDIAIYTTSGFRNLDRIAMQALADASPLPPIPDEAGTESLKGKIRITFRPAN
jgi:TonB family protein